MARFLCDFDQIERAIYVKQTCKFLMRYGIIVSSKTRYHSLKISGVLVLYTVILTSSFILLLLQGAVKCSAVFRLVECCGAIVFIVQGGMEMNPRERIATILFIEQLKHTEVTVCQGVTYKELVFREEEKANGNKKDSQ